MKIHELEQINKHLSQDKTQKKSSPEKEFQALLEKELGQDAVTKNINTLNTPESLTPHQLSELEVSLKMEKARETSIQDPKETIMNKIENTLSKWEKYSQSLQQNDLKGSYSLLQEIMKDISALEKNATEQREEDRSVFSLVNELKIMATTEEARFTRGEYL